MNGTKGANAWDDRIRASLARVVDEGRWRAPREFDALGPAGLLEGDPVLSFASNDYLGLSLHPAVVAAAHDALDRWGASAGASRLVTGSRPVHRELECELADWKGTEAAVTFPTGFSANLGVLSALGGPGVLILSDELNHASIIDGCRLSRSALTIYRHCDMGHLEELLGDATLPTIVVSDSVFSMDGDVAPISELVTLCRDTTPSSFSMRLTPSSARTFRCRSIPAAWWCVSARCRRRWARSAVSWQPLATSWISSSTGLARTSSRPPRPRPTLRPPSLQSESCVPPKAPP